MKNLFKTAFIALAIATSLAACSGNNSTHVPDSTRVDSAKMDTTAGKNGMPNSPDTSYDKSASGGTDAVKK
jgi:predicted small lipoprotein YifL